MRVLLVDGHRLAGQCLSAAFVRMGADVELVDQPPGCDPVVDVVVINVRTSLPEVAEQVGRLRAVAPSARVVCLVPSEVDGRAADAALPGAVVLSRGLALHELVAVVLNPGSRRPRPRVAQRSLPLMVRFLTPREREVLQLLAAARSTGQIAAELGITVATARGYVQSVISKLGVHTRLEAVAYAARHELLATDSWSSAG